MQFNSRIARTHFASIMTLNLCFGRKQRRNKQREKQYAKTILFVRQMHMRKYHLFCASMHQNIPYGTTQDLNIASESCNECSCESTCTIDKSAPYRRNCNDVASCRPSVCRMCKVPGWCSTVVGEASTLIK